MGTVSVECLSEILANPANKGYATFQMAYDSLAYHLDNQPKLNVSAENASALLGQVRTYLTNVGYLPYKQLRPWELNKELYSSLDQTATWWGWEFETGYVTKPACATVVGHVWDTWNHVCFDGEGEGAHVSEITFAPIEVGKFADRSAPAYQFMQYISDNRELTNRTDYDSVGTHLNFSTPAIRGASGGALMMFVVYSLNNTIHALPIDSTNPRKRLFGRDNIYAGCFERSDMDGFDSNGRTGMRWIECKLFRTTYTIEEYDQYVRTATGMMKCVAALEAAWNGKDKSKTYISNFVEVVDNGAEPIVAVENAMYGGGEGAYVSGQDMDDDGYYDGDDGECDCESCRADRAAYDSGDSW